MSSIDRFAQINRTKGVYAVNPLYVVIPEQKTTMTAKQKKLKARKQSRQSRAYNFRRAK